MKCFSFNSVEQFKRNEITDCIVTNEQRKKKKTKKETSRQIYIYSLNIFCCKKRKKRELKSEN